MTLVLALMGWLVRRVRRHPLLTVVALVVLWVLEGDGAPVAAAVAGLCLLVATGLLTWRLVDAGSFDRLLGSRWRARRLQRWYAGQWAQVMTAHGLSLNRGRDLPTLVPGLGRITCTPGVVVVPVALCPGQVPGDFTAAAEGLAHALGATSCRVTTLGPGRVELRLLHGDPLAATVPALPMGRSVDLSAVPVGIREDGSPWTVRLLGAHLLLAGVTGAGKGSVLWSLLRGLAPDIALGRVAVWAVDLKGGMELALGRPLVQRLVSTTAEDAADLLEDAVRVLDARAQALQGVTRLHEPNVAEPLLLLVVDELASLTAYVPDRAVKARLATALALIQSKGRAVGVLVVGAVQDPRKETVPLRDLFTVRVALRLPDRELVDMVLGAGASARGARADTIPLSTPGVGYVVLDGDPDPVRVRAGHVTDADLAAMAMAYPAPAPTLVVPPRPVVDDDPAEDRPRAPRRPRTARRFDDSAAAGVDAS